EVPAVSDGAAFRSVSTARVLQSGRLFFVRRQTSSPYYRFHRAGRQDSGRVGANGCPAISGQEESRAFRFVPVTTRSPPPCARGCGTRRDVPCVVDVHGGLETDRGEAGGELGGQAL